LLRDALNKILDRFDRTEIAAKIKAEETDAIND
jgi:hypothetical protein